MALIDPVKKACDRLADKGWAALLARHGLDIGKTDLAKELVRPLAIDRGVPGFGDFCTAGKRGIEPRRPAASLLYHAFASPDVHPTLSGQLADANDAYPTLAELDAVENYIFALAPLRPGALKGAVIAVFAYEYRPAASTAHGYHADMVFSRTGVARVGTGPAAWDGPTRGFRPDPPGRSDLAVLPARYGAFIARPRPPQSKDPIMGQRDQKDMLRTFYFPVHKLFAGNQCVAGSTLKIKFDEYHRNDKLRRIHKSGHIPIYDGFDLNAFPFIRDSTNDDDLVELVRRGDSVLLSPRAHKSMVRTVKQKNSVSGRNEIVRFVVPPLKTHDRFESSLTIAVEGAARIAPEYVNIRHPVTTKRGEQQVGDMQNLPEDEFDRLVLKKGGYEAAHYIDDSCDGSLVAIVDGLPARVADLAAYSLVTAPDFFPLSDQLEITSWVRRNFQNAQEHFSQGAPWPLCEGRMPANFELPRPDSQRPAFDDDDESIAAVVGMPALSTATHAPGRKKRFASHLTDAAANVFEPGWDISLAVTRSKLHYAAYGLGSPFPEDAKLCAALNSYWPAVAPDASRTFNFQFSPTAIPMLDGELGYHPGHPRVRAGIAKSAEGWDGEHGPFLETVEELDYVNYANPERSDYVSNCLRGAVTVRLTAAVDSDELIARMESLRRCIKALPPGQDRVSTTKLWLVVAEAIPNWETQPRRAKEKLIGPGYLYVLVKTTGGKPKRDGFRRLRVRVEHKYECQISGGALFWRRDDDPWQPGD
jgi:hypothetical protein